jgi:alkylation response protein AidB-like acyl-CoA dehydrogenase
MRFTWSDEQRLLRETLRKYVAERYSFEYRRQRIARGLDAQMWAQLAELGVLGLPFEEKYGGGAGSPLDVLIVMEAFGRGLVVEPYLPTVVLGGGLLRRAADERQKSRLIPAIIRGELRLALAFAEQQSRFNLAHIETRARQVDAGYVLRGRKIVVYGAPECHSMLVTARTSGDVLDRHGVSVFLVPRDARGLKMRSYTCVDGMAAAEVIFDDVHIGPDGLIGEPDRMLPAIEQVIDEASAATCGEGVGAMAALNEKCVEYARTREAFGMPIANFQVMGHRLVDMHVAYEQASSLAIKAAVRLASGAADSARTVSACKVKVGQEAAFVGKSAVQLHGAMGMTDELDIGHYFKRLMAIQTTFGSTDYHLRRYMALGESAHPEPRGA